MENNSNSYYQENREEILKRQRKYHNENKEKISQQQKEYHYRNKEKRNKNSKEYVINRKIKVFNILGKVKCEFCEEKRLECLTIDHIDNSGFIDKKLGLRDHSLYSAILKGKYPKEKLSNLRVLCYNHNCSRPRGYITLPKEKQTSAQKYQLKFWQKAYEFFGPCKTCGEKTLQFLTISHIHNDGSDMKRKGQRGGVNLLYKFERLGWPESLKEDFCLECFNCNCGRKNI